MRGRYFIMKNSSKVSNFIFSVLFFIILNLLGSYLVGDVSFWVSVFSFAIVKYADLNGDSLIFSNSNFKGITLPVIILFSIGVFVAFFWKNSLYPWYFDLFIVICFGTSLAVLQKNFWNWFNKKF